MQVVLPPTQPLDHPVRPELELVSGGRGEPQPLTNGLRLVRDILRARSCVLFSVLPQTVEWHAALGEDSAMLAAQLGQHRKSCIAYECDEVTGSARTGGSFLELISKLILKWVLTISPSYNPVQEVIFY